METMDLLAYASDPGSDDVREDADEDASDLDAIHPDLRAAVAEAIGDRDEQP